MRFAFTWLLARIRRAVCWLIGCQPVTATFVDSMHAWFTSVHCHRCWRRYSDDEMHAAIRVAKRGAA